MPGTRPRPPRHCSSLGFAILQLAKVYAQVLEGNRPSCHVLEKLGMIEEGVRRCHIRKGKRLLDVTLYGMLKEEWATAAVISASDATPARFRSRSRGQVRRAGPSTGPIDVRRRDASSGLSGMTSRLRYQAIASAPTLTIETTNEVTQIQRGNGCRGARAASTISRALASVSGSTARV